MTITGEALIRQALDGVLGGDATADQLEFMARRSRVLIDSLNLSEEMLGKRESEHDAALAAGAASFTWGAGGVIDTLPPAAVRRWAIIEDNGAEDPRGELATPAEWSIRETAYGRTGRPVLAWWRREPDAAGRQQITVAPTPAEAVNLRFWALIPALEQVDLGTTYTLPAGVAAYVSLSMAIDAGAAYSMPVSPALYAERAAAADRLQSVPSDEVQQADPRWLVGQAYDWYGYYGGY